MNTIDKPAIIALSALVLIWGSNFAFVKWAEASITSAQIICLRLMLGFVPLLALAVWRGVLRVQHLRHWPHFVVMSILATVFYYYSFANGAALMPSGVPGMLSGAIPLLTFVLASLLLKKQPLTRRKIFGLTLGFLGVLLIARPWSGDASSLDFRSVGYMTLGSLGIGSSFVYAKRYMANLDIPPLALSVYQVGLALCILGAVTPFAGLSRIGGGAVTIVGLVLGLGLTGAGSAYVLNDYIVQRMGELHASEVICFPPVVVPLIGCLLTAESMCALDLIAMASILFGVYATQTPGRAESAAQVSGIEWRKR